MGKDFLHWNALIDLNPVPNDKILGLAKLKAFADKLKVARMMISLLDRVENTVGKEEHEEKVFFVFFMKISLSLILSF